MFTPDHSIAAADEALLDGKKITIGIVVSRTNPDITQALAVACRAELTRLGVMDKHITQISVPGALEIPVALLAMAEKLKFDALIALGCIIRGETFHFELVSREAAAGISHVALEYQMPIANAVLATDTLEQAVARQTDKGRDAARVAVEMANLLESV